jgi:3-oxoacyl-[acyl-carrier-protein] synthase-3
MIGRANGTQVSITGLGCSVPDRVVTNEDLSKVVETSDEWIVSRTGIKERRLGDGVAMSELALPAARRALEQAGVDPKEIDVLIMATVTPDMAFPSTAAIIADQLGMPDAAAYDLSAGCTGFMYALAQAYGMLAAGSRRRRWSLAATCSRRSRLDRPLHARPLRRRWPARSCSSGSTTAGSSAFELGATAAAASTCGCPGAARAGSTTRQGIKMNGREVFKFATRVMVSSAEAILDECGLTVEDVDVYVPHQANVRIIDHAARKLGFPEEKVVVNVDRYGNTSSGSIPLALADAAADGRLNRASWC